MPVELETSPRVGRYAELEDTGQFVLVVRRLDDGMFLVDTGVEPRLKLPGSVLTAALAPRGSEGGPTKSATRGEEMNR